MFVVFDEGMKIGNLAFLFCRKKQKELIFKT